MVKWFMDSELPEDRLIRAVSELDRKVSMVMAVLGLDPNAVMLSAEPTVAPKCSECEVERTPLIEGRCLYCLTPSQRERYVETLEGLRKSYGPQR